MDEPQTIYIDKKDKLTHFVYIVDKDQLLDPKFLEEIKSQKKPCKVSCNDSDLSFDENEYPKLLKLYEELKKQNMFSKLVFVEKVSTSIYLARNKGFKSPNDNSKDFKSAESSTVEFNHSFKDVVKANKLLLDFAKKVKDGYINENGEKVQLSPAEKYAVCYSFINDFVFYIEDDSKLSKSDEYLEEHISDPKRNYSRSFIKTARSLKGCCVGKSLCLKSLLRMVDIDAASFSLSLEKSLIPLYPELIIPYHNGLKQFLGMEINHKTNIVSIDDDKYNIHGIYHADTNTEKTEDINMMLDDINLSLEGITLGSFLKTDLDLIKLIKNKVDLNKLNENSEVVNNIINLQNSHTQTLGLYFKSLFPDISESNTHLTEMLKTLYESLKLKTITFDSLKNTAKQQEEYVQQLGNDKDSEIERYVSKILNDYVQYINKTATFQSVIAYIAKQNNTYTEEKNPNKVSDETLAKIKSVADVAYKQFISNSKHVKDDTLNTLI